MQLEACWRWVSLLGLLYDGSMLMHMWGLSFYGLLGLQYIFIYTVNPGPFSCNYQAVNCKQVFLYSNSTVQTLKSTVSENSLMFLSWNHFPTKTTKCSLNFKNPLSTDLMTNLEIHVGSFWYSPNLLVHKIYDRDVINSQYL